MAQDFMQLADRSRLATDTKTASIDKGSGPKDFILHRQQVVLVPGSSSEATLPPGQLLVSYLLGSGGVADANVDGSVTEALYEYAVPVGKALHLETARVMVRDAGALLTTAASFGAGPALVDGVRLELVAVNGTTVMASLVPGAVKRNLDFVSIPGAAVELQLADVLVTEIPLRMDGWPVTLVEGQRIRMTVSDNLTGLDGMRASVRGRLVDA